MEIVCTDGMTIAQKIGAYRKEFQSVGYNISDLSDLMSNPEFRFEDLDDEMWAAAGAIIEGCHDIAAKFPRETVQGREFID